MAHLSLAELTSQLEAIREAPSDHGSVELIVRRPAVDAREVLDVAELDTEVGLVGDSWIARGSSETSDGRPHPDRQLTLMRSRVIAFMAQDRSRWPLAGDQLYVDLDLSIENLPPGTRLAIGTAVIEVTEPPHNGCAKFSQRFGVDALRFVNSEAGKQFRLRGLNAKVVEAGSVRLGNTIAKA
jgi:MOSC domain-containing protein YiiM